MERSFCDLIILFLFFPLCSGFEMWDGFSSSFHSLGLGFHFFGDKRA